MLLTDFTEQIELLLPWGARQYTFDDKSTLTDMTTKQEKHVFTPFRVDEPSKKIVVGFEESARVFTLDGDKQTELTLLQEALSRREPLVVHINTASNEIVKVEKPGEKAKATWLARQVRPGKKGGDEKTVSLIAIPNLQKLAQLWDIIVSQACPSPGDCIPFRFATDGCYARAHKMRQTLVNYGYDCQKCFIYGDLAAMSPLGCAVQWVYHVVPLVTVNDASGTRDFILDPSLFQHPTSYAEWAAACTDKTVLPSAAIQFHVGQPGEIFTYNPQAGVGTTDNTYTVTDCVLNAFSGLSGCGVAPSVAACWN